MYALCIRGRTGGLVTIVEEATPNQAWREAVAIVRALAKAGGIWERAKGRNMYSAGDYYVSPLYRDDRVMTSSTPCPKRPKPRAR